MAKYSNEVVYNIKTTLDASGVRKLQSELAQLKQTISATGGMKLGMNPSQIQSSIAQINKLQSAITACFNPKLGMLDLTKLNSQIKNQQISLNKISSDWTRLGAQGKTAINSMVTSLTAMNREAIQASSSLSKIATTFGNTVRWGITASIFQSMMGSISGCVGYMKQLDESLTQIQMVTSNTAEDMRDLARYANEAAQSLASTTVEYTNAIKVFTQEGFSLGDSKIQAELAVTLANVSEQDTATTADQITAYRNAFGLSLEETTQSLDRIANLANNTAANVSELMTASQRSASVAASVGASEEQFLASIATIQSVTRQSAEEIGNGLKTIYQRFADIKVSGSTDDGVDYGQYATALKQVGVDVLDASGEFKGMDQIFSELQAVWGDLSETMKIAVGEKVAGKFQYNRFAALMNNQEYYDKAYAATQNADGVMADMQSEYADSIEGRLNTLKAAGEQIITTMFNQDAIEPVLEDLTEFANAINTIVEVAGGAQGVFEALAAVMLRAFSSQIGEQIQRMATNMSQMAMAAGNTRNMQATFDSLGINTRPDLTTQTSTAVGMGMSSYFSLTTEGKQKFSETANAMAEAENALNVAMEKTAALQAEVNEQQNISLGLIDEQRGKLSGQILDRQKLLEGLREEADALKLNEQAESEEAALLQDRISMIESAITSDKDRLNILKDISKTVESQGTLSEKQIQFLRDINSEYAKAEERLRAQKVEAEKLVEEFRKAAEQMATMNQKNNGAAIAASFSKMGSAAMSAAFAMSSLKSIQTVLADETKTTKEKIDECLISFIMLGSMGVSAITSVVSGVKGISTGLNGMAATMSAINTVQATSNALTEAGTVLQNGKTLANMTEIESQTLYNSVMAIGNTETLKAIDLKNAEALATNTSSEAIALKTIMTQLDCDANEAAIVAETMLNNQKRVGVARTLLFNAATAMGIPIKTADAAATGAATAATMAFGATLWAVLWPIGLVIAGIAGLVAIGKTLYDMYNADAIAAEKAIENAQKAADAYKSLKDSYKSLQDTVANYTAAKDALADLKQGTEEWNTKLQEVNDTVLELLDKYPQLAEYITLTKSGEMLISEEGLGELDRAQRERVDNARNISIAQSARAQQARAQSRYTDTRRNIGTWQGNGQGSSYVAIDPHSFDEVVELAQQVGGAQNLTAENIASALNMQPDNPLIQSILQNSEDIARYINDSNALNAAYQIQMEQICNSILNKIPGSEDYDAPEEGLAVDMYNQLYEQEMTRLGSSTVENVVTEFEELMGDGATYVNRGSSILTDRDNVYDVGGNTYTVEQMEQMLAEANAQEALANEDFAQAIFQATEEIQQSSVGQKYGSLDLASSIFSGNNKTGDAHRDFDYSSIDIASQMSLVRDFSGYANTDEGNAAMAQALGITEAEAEAKGYENAGAYARAYANGLAQQIPNIESVIIDATLDEQLAALNDNLSDKDLAETLGITDEEAQLLGYESGEEYAAAWREGVQAEAGEDGLTVDDLIQSNNITGEQLGLTEDYLSQWKNSDSLQTFDTNASIIAAQTNDDGMGFSLDNYVDAITTLAGKYTNTAAETEALTKAQNDLNEAIANGTEEEIAAAQATFNAAEDELRLSIRAGELGEQFGFTADEIEDYARELRESNKYAEITGEELAEMAKEQKRYDRALESATDHMEDWKDAVEEAADGGELSAEAAGEMRDAYGDLLDLDGSNLTDGFLQNADNLDLMERAMNGDIDAYNQLLEAAQTDMEVKFGLNDEEFQSKKMQVESQMDAMNFENIEVGADLNIDGFLDGLTDMVNASGMTAEQATDYLSSMGIDAEVETVTQDSPPTIVGYNTPAHWVPVDGGTVDVLDGASTKPVHVTGGYWRYDNPTPVYDQGSQASGTSLRVISANKSSGGGVKFANRSSGGGGGSRSGGGGGGGGGGGSKKTEKKMERKDNKWSYLNDINDNLDRSTAKVNKLNDSTDRLFGNAKIKNLRTINSELTKQNKIYADKQKLLEAELKKQQTSDTDSDGKNTLQYYAKQAGIKLEFDADGSLKDGIGLQISEALRANYNKQVDKYNRSSQTDSDKEALDKQKEIFDGFFDAYSRYNDTQSELDDVKAAIFENTASVQDNNDAIIDMKKDMLDGWKDMLDEWRDYQENHLKLFEEGLTAAVERDAMLASNAFKDLLGDGSITLGQIDANSLFKVAGQQLQNAYTTYLNVKAGKDTSLTEEQAYENLQDALSTVTDYEGELADSIDDLRDSIDDMIDLMADEIEARIDQYEAFADRIESITDIASTVYGEDSKTFYAMQQKASGDMLNAQQGKLDTINAAIVKYSSIVQKLQAKGHELTQEETEQLRDAQEELTDYQQQQLETEQEMVETLQQFVEAAIGGNLRVTADTILGMDKDWAQQLWESDTAVDEQWLDDVNRAAETQKLQYKYQQLINDTSTLNAETQGRIAEHMRQQLGYLRDKNELSQYDVDYANAQLDILQKQIALEDAQNNKSQMRLQRDASGNYNYMYTANQDDVVQKQQDLLDARLNAYNMTKQAWLEARENMINAFDDADDKLTSIVQNMEISAIEKEERITKILGNLQSYIQNLSDQTGTAGDNIIDDMNDISAIMERINKMKGGSLLESVEDYTSIESRFADFVYDAIQNNGNITDSFTALKDSILEASEQYANGVGAVAGTSEDELGSALDATGEAIDLANDSFDEFGSTLDKIEGKINSLIDTLGVMTKAAQTAASSVANVVKASTQSLVNTNVDIATSDANGNSKGITDTISSMTDVLASSIGIALKDSGININDEAIKRIHDAFADFASSYAQMSGIQGFDTGGYTGMWGNEGRLALLHQKELVLNAGETQDILEAVQLVRQMRQNAMSSVLDVSKLNLTSLGNQDTIEQRVEINANFPDVQSADEIRNALLSLADTAYMNAHRNY